MGKRSDFPRFPQDKYDTPLEAVMPLLEHLKPHTQFIEPCAGDGYLIGHLKRAEHVCIGAYDLPSHDARVTRYAVEGADAFISNTPWRVDIMHPIIANLSDQAPAWLLLYSDWLFTKQAIPFLPRLRDVVAIGRVRWIPDSKHDGKDNACWCQFGRPDPHAATRFFGRALANAHAAVGCFEQTTMPVPITLASLAHHPRALRTKLLA